MKFNFNNLRNKVGIGLILLLVISLFLSFAFAKEKTDNKGLITYTKGRVKKKEFKDFDWKKAESNSSILNGDKIRTYQKSRAELELMDLDVIRIAPETIILVEKLYEETKEKIKETQISLEKGNVWAKIKKKKKNMKFGITSPVAVAAITGTVLRMNVNPDSSTVLKVYNGEVHITNAPENTNLIPKMIQVHEISGPYEVPGPHEISMDEWVYIVRNMQKIIIDNKGKIMEVGDFKLSDKEEDTDWVKWNLERDKLIEH